MLENFMKDGNFIKYSYQFNSIFADIKIDSLMNLMKKIKINV